MPKSGRLWPLIPKGFDQTLSFIDIQGDKMKWFPTKDYDNLLYPMILKDLHGISKGLLNVIEIELLKCWYFGVIRKNQVFFKKTRFFPWLRIKPGIKISTQKKVG